MSVVNNISSDNFESILYAPPDSSTETLVTPFQSDFLDHTDKDENNTPDFYYTYGTHRTLSRMPSIIEAPSSPPMEASPRSLKKQTSLPCVQSPASPIGSTRFRYPRRLRRVGTLSIGNYDRNSTGSTTRNFTSAIDTKIHQGGSESQSSNSHDKAVDQSNPKEGTIHDAFSNHKSETVKSTSYSSLINSYGCLPGCTTGEGDDNKGESLKEHLNSPEAGPKENPDLPFSLKTEVQFDTAGTLDTEVQTQTSNPNSSWTRCATIRFVPAEHKIISGGEKQVREATNSDSNRRVSSPIYPPHTRERSRSSCDRQVLKTASSPQGLGQLGLDSSDVAKVTSAEGAIFSLTTSETPERELMMASSDTIQHYEVDKADNPVQDILTRNLGALGDLFSNNGTKELSDDTVASQPEMIKEQDEPVNNRGENMVAKPQMSHSYSLMPKITPLRPETHYTYKPNHNYEDDTTATPALSQTAAKDAEEAEATLKSKPTRKQIANERRIQGLDSHRVSNMGRNIKRRLSSIFRTSAVDSNEMAAAYAKFGTGSPTVKADKPAIRTLRSTMSRRNLKDSVLDSNGYEEQASTRAQSPVRGMRKRLSQLFSVLKKPGGASAENQTRG